MSRSTPRHKPKKSSSAAPRCHSWKMVVEAVSRGTPRLIRSTRTTSGTVRSFARWVVASWPSVSVSYFGETLLHPGLRVGAELPLIQGGAHQLLLAGNLGSFITSLAFPYLLAWTGSHLTFFYVAAGLNVLAAALWLFVRPERPLV